MVTALILVDVPVAARARLAAALNYLSRRLLALALLKVALVELTASLTIMPWHAVLYAHVSLAIIAACS